MADTKATIEEVRAAVKKAGSIRGAARILGMSRTSVMDRVAKDWRDGNKPACANVAQTGSVSVSQDVKVVNLKSATIRTLADALEGLLHDAHEAFVGDMSSPLKVALPAYKELENIAERELRARFGLAEKMPDSVRLADKKALAKEALLLLPAHAPWPYLEGVEIPLGDPYLGRSPDDACTLFLNRYKELTDGR